MANSDPRLDSRRRKLAFRSWHRGMREVDLLLGPFADANLAALTEAELDQYEAMLEQSDTVLLPYLLGQLPLPETGDLALLRKIAASSGSLRSDR